ncbi:hypothetical protein YDYSY3_38630 [Paenibacillus chitinolyticus]|uniref:DEAD/DEAH box helicase n=1 Tax=Paenibacillus chitinolyticus TaxID=79263 RepID=UPI0026E49E69|nr:hypothetical protein [Paenibacillus chitinolyticus]GKS12863.1 hypothetical protein YDYSY3_38630 [Paenibacillus chitinolyticus]
MSHIIETANVAPTLTHAVADVVHETESEAGPQNKNLADIRTIGDYLGMFGGDLIRRLNEEYVPVHHPGKDQTLELLNDVKRPLFNAQAHVTTALIKGFRLHRRLFLIGEMGTGKTSISIASFFSLIREVLGGKGRVIYMVPNHLIKKTKREIGILLDKKDVEVHILQNYKDVIQLRDSGKMEGPAKKIEVYVIARDTCKLGYIYEPAVRWVERTYTIRQKDRENRSYKKTVFEGWVCPDCGGQLMKEEADGTVPMEYEDFFNKHGKETRRKYNLTCRNEVRLYKNRDPEQDEYRLCGSPLWTAKNKDKSSFKGESRKPKGSVPRKVSPADIFKRYFKNRFDLAIGDECHELTGGSAQAHAFHVLMGCAKRTLAMTGTLMNGYASNLFELIYRMMPRRLKSLGFEWGDVGKWIDLYGVRERVTKTRQDTDLNSSSNGNSTRKSTKERPAAAPQLFTDILSDVACFIQMADMFEVLPKLQEGPLNVSLQGERQFVNFTSKIDRKPGQKKRQLEKKNRLMAPHWYLNNNLNQVSNLLRKAVNEELRKGGQSVLLGSLLNTLLSYPDVPFNFEGVYHPDTKKVIVPDSFRLSERLIYPKELQLIQFVKARIKAGRKVGIYATYTGKLGTLERLQTLLEEHGVRTAVLEANVPGPEREEWIAKREQEGIQVLLTNPILVSTGLDLLGFPSLFFYQTGYRLTIVRQASRRHWRIGQKNLCETVYSSYSDTMQELALNLMAAKMNAALALEGQFSQEGLSALTEGSGGSLASELAKRFVGNKIDGVESAESIWGKMSVDASELHIQSGTDLKDIIDEESQFEEQSTVFYGETLEEALIDWANEWIPTDLFDRFQNQIEYVVENVEKGIACLTSTKETLIGPFSIVWHQDKAPQTEQLFRRWAYSLTNKPLGHSLSKTGGVNLELLVEGKKPKTKTKKVYNVSEGQIAFNF